MTEDEEHNQQEYPETIDATLSSTVRYMYRCRCLIEYQFMCAMFLFTSIIQPEVTADEPKTVVWRTTGGYLAGIKCTTWLLFLKVH